MTTALFLYFALSFLATSAVVLFLLLWMSRPKGTRFRMKALFAAMQQRYRGFKILIASFALSVLAYSVLLVASLLKDYR